MITSGNISPCMLIKTNLLFHFNSLTHFLTSLEEEDRFSSASILRHRQGSSDVTPQAIKACLNDFRIARFQNIIVVSPIPASLQKCYGRNFKMNQKDFNWYQKTFAHYKRSNRFVPSDPI